MAELKHNEIYFAEGWVFHSRSGVRSKPKSWIEKAKYFLFKDQLRNSFKYPIFNLLLPLHVDDVLEKVSERSIISICSQDYLNSEKGSLIQNFLTFIKSQSSDSYDQIWLQTLPRMFGYVFNPVSFWYLYNEGQLKSVLCEVNNTFGDRHFYFLTDLQKNNGYATAQKKFHVSPFFDIKGHYDFQFKEDEKSNFVSIKYDEENNFKLDTQIFLKFRPLYEVSSFFILKKYGWMTVLVIFRIHYQAVKLWIKGAKFHSRPLPPKERITYDSKGH